MFSVMADVMIGSSTGGNEGDDDDDQRRAARRRCRSGMCVACTVCILYNSTIYHVCICYMCVFVKYMMYWFCR